MHDVVYTAWAFREWSITMNAFVVNTRGLNVVFDTSNAVLLLQLSNLMHRSTWEMILDYILSRLPWFYAVLYLYHNLICQPFCRPVKIAHLCCHRHQSCVGFMPHVLSTWAVSSSDNNTCAFIRCRNILFSLFTSLRALSFAFKMLILKT